MNINISDNFQSKIFDLPQEPFVIGYDNQSGKPTLFLVLAVEFGARRNANIDLYNMYSLPSFFPQGHYGYPTRGSEILDNLNNNKWFICKSNLELNIENKIETNNETIKYINEINQKYSR